MMMYQADVIVIGGGVVGLCAAIAMRQRGFSVIVLERGPMTGDPHVMDKRVYAINAASERLLRTLMDWNHLDCSSLSPYRRMHVWDNLTGASIDFDARMIGTGKLGLIMEESLVKHQLIKQATEQSVRLLADSTVTGIDTHSDRVHVASNNGICEGQLLMIADGAQSTARDLLGVSVTHWSYDQTALVATVHVEKPHQQTAYQVFHSKGPLAFLPLASEQACSIVWSTTPMDASRLMSLPDEAFNVELTRAFANTLGPCTVQSSRHVFPLHMRHTREYVGERWLLLGDAAHTIHPLAGLGLNLGLADLTTWLSLLDAHPRKWLSKRTLGAYQRARRYEGWKTIGMLQGIKTVFSGPAPFLGPLRGFGMTVCNQLAPLKRWLIHQANK